MWRTRDLEPGLGGAVALQCPCEPVPSCVRRSSRPSTQPAETHGAHHRRAPLSTVERRPPSGCSTRAVWCSRALTSSCWPRATAFTRLVQRQMLGLLGVRDFLQPATGSCRATAVTRPHSQGPASQWGRGPRAGPAEASTGAPLS